VVIKERYQDRAYERNKYQVFRDEEKKIFKYFRNKERECPRDIERK
jgi:hypothetical protein